MSEDMDPKGIYFDLQWKTNSGGSNTEEFGSFGIWEVDDSSLHWFTFKPYLCQILGNVENVSVSYIDSEGDEIPIDSDLEFQEALKFARQKAAMKQKIVLKVEKLDTQSAATGGAEFLNNPIYLKSSNFFKERLKISSNGEEQDVFNVSLEGPIKMGNSSRKMKTKSKSKEVTCPLQICDTPPLWFIKYMKKMKSEIISEVSANINNQMKEMFDSIAPKGQPSIFPTGTSNPNLSHKESAESSTRFVTKTKKKTSDDDSSDGAHKIEIKDSKILKKIEKLHRRERKLDHKKEKLEQKTKRIVDRKEREYLSKLRLEIAGWKVPHIESTTYKKMKEFEILRQKVNEKATLSSSIPTRDVKTTPMGVSVYSDDMNTMSVKPGSNFTKVWRVINFGSAPWTEETELRLSWRNSGLIPETPSVKCPLLAPGEEGEIAVNFTAPNFPGLFESHWHFFHQNVRFAGRVSCIVSVDLIKVEDEAKSEPRNLNSSLSRSSEFLVVASTSHFNENNTNAGDECKKNDSVNVPEGASSGSVNHDDTLAKCDSFSSASEQSLKDKKLNDEKYILIGQQEAEVESISTDDLSGSEQSLGSESDDNFVVVPMPPCFRIDVPLNSSDPNVAKTDSVERVETVVESKNSETNWSPEPPSTSIELDHDAESNTQFPDHSHLNEIPVQREVSHDTGEVISVPILPSQPKSSVGTSQFQPTVTHAAKIHIAKPRVIILNKSDEPTFSPITPPHVSSSTRANASSNSDRSSPGSSTTSESSKSKESASRREHKHKAKQSDNIPNTKPTPRSFPTSSRPVDLQPRIVTEVINGALSATSSALNTAFAALDSILETATGSQVTPGTVYTEQTKSQPERVIATDHEDPPPPPIDPVMANGLSVLANMGFVDIELNQALLRVHNHNLPEVIEALLNGRP